MLRARKGYQPPVRERITAVHLLETTSQTTNQGSSQLARPVQVITINESMSNSISKAYVNLLKQRHQGKLETDEALLEALIKGVFVHAPESEEHTKLPMMTYEQQCR